MTTNSVIYPGTFDPVTNGHVDLIKRGLGIFKEVIVGVAMGEDKHPLFSVEERLSLIQQATPDLTGVKVEWFDGLLVNYLHQKGAKTVIRGLRAVSDFEYELQMALLNRQISNQIETIFLMPSQDYIFLSSRIVKTVARLGGDVSNWVPPIVNDALKRKYLDCSEKATRMG